jgi:exodeoxyribonuclease VII large subunit
VAPSRQEILAALDDLAKHARQRLLQELREAAARVRGLRQHHALREPSRRVRDGYVTIDRATESLRRGLADWVFQRARRLEGHAGRLRAHTPQRSLERMRDRLAGLEGRFARAASDGLARRRDRVTAREALLRSYDYHGVLRRGYALVWSRDGAVLVPRAAGLRPEDVIEVQFEDARAEARVTRAPLPARKETS